MERIIDYLAEEEKQQAKIEARKAGKHDRIEAMLKAGLRTIQP